MVILQSNETNIYRNLAKEEFLFSLEDVSLPVLFLWQSSPAVVIGKHQNPWRECLVDELKANSIPLARRISGGGTVYHDLGNLNYTVLSDRQSYDAGKIYEMIFQALKTFGLIGKIENKSNLCIDGLKFSGNAFAYRKQKALHHGTLLVKANLEKLRHYLKPQYPEIETKAIASIPASVVNLNNLNPEISIESLSAAIEQSFTKTFAENQEIAHWTDKNIDQKKVANFAKNLQAEQWLFGKTPDFTITINGKSHLIQHGDFSLQ